MACEPMSARVYNGTLVLVTDGGACGRNGYLVSALASFTGEKLLGRNSYLFASSPFEKDDFSRDRLGTNARKTQQWMAFHTANASALHGMAPFTFQPTDPPLLTDHYHFPPGLGVRDWAFRVMPKDGPPRFVGVATGSGNRDRNATFSTLLQPERRDGLLPPHLSYCNLLPVSFSLVRF